MPVPVKNELLERQPNNYENVVKRDLILKRSALRDQKRLQILTYAFAELVREQRDIIV